MALSDRDQLVLSEMEAALRVSTARLPADRGTHHYLAAAIGLMLAGAAVTLLGLRLADGVGTVSGVLGFLLVVGSAWTVRHLRAPLRSWTRTGSPKAAGKPC